MSLLTVAERAGEVRHIGAAHAQGELVGRYALGKAVSSEGAEVELAVVATDDRLALEFGVVEEVNPDALAGVEIAEVVDGVVLVGKFAALEVSDLGVWNGIADAFEQGVLVVVGRGAAVVAVEQGNVVGVRTYDDDFLEVL